MASPPPSAIRKRPVDSLLQAADAKPSYPDSTAGKRCGGYPWSIPGADEGVDYTPEQFPEALKYCDSHIAIVTALRAPNTPDTARHLADALNKVMAHIHEIDPNRILKK